MCHTFMCHKYHVKHISKQCNLEWIEKGHQQDANLRCAYYAPQTNALWRGEEKGTTKVLLYTWPRRVGVGCLRVLMEWVVWMCNRTMLRASFTKKRMHNLGLICLPKMMCSKVWVWGVGEQGEVGVKSQCPAFVVYYSVEVRMHHMLRGACARPPGRRYALACSHVCARKRSMTNMGRKQNGCNSTHDVTGW